MTNFKANQLFLRQSCISVVTTAAEARILRSGDTQNGNAAASTAPEHRFAFRYRRRADTG